MKNILVLILIIISTGKLSAQFDNQVGFGAKNAIHKDSSIIKAWATKTTLQRGWQDISDTSLGKATVGTPFYTTGIADGTVLSLGDSGIAILQFERPITNGQGYDFCVFENGFTLNSGVAEAFLEYAHVEVSSDGVQFFRFPSQSKIDTLVQKASFDYMNTNLVDGLAGKYIANYGTPFDLAVLANQPNLNINKITHVKIIDVVGSINNVYATRDGLGNKINDPWPTPFAAGGFDLDAVGVMNQAEPNGIANSEHEVFKVYPNPAKAGDKIYINNSQQASISLFDANGKCLLTKETSEDSFIDTEGLHKGVYILLVNELNKTYTKTLMLN
ncbi:MAG: T9SS type A sorting domain-containing protein [Bacteroidota bacterium]